MPLSRDPLDNPDLTPEQRAALDGLTEAERIAIGEAFTQTYLALKVEGQAEIAEVDASRHDPVFVREDRPGEWLALAHPVVQIIARSSERSRVVAEAIAANQRAAGVDRVRVESL